MKKRIVKNILTSGVVSCLLLSVGTPVFATNQSDVSIQQTLNNSEELVTKLSEDTTDSSATTDSELTTSENLTSEKLSTSEVTTESELTSDSVIESETTESTEESTIPSEKKSVDTFKAPIITEENQHVLGNTMKQARAALPRLNWDANRLPRTDFIDISSHQGTMTVANFNNLKKYGVTGVIVKLTEATSYRNPFAGSQIANAKAAGLKVSVYHYSWFHNKQAAEAEADYFIKFAKELGLSSDTIMINDIEEPQIITNTHTENSVAFAKRLISKGATKTVLHYSSLSWFNDGRLNVQKLGGALSIWIAQYPYAPSNQSLLHTDKAAWQWASDVKFPGDSRQFDVNIDYSGRFSITKGPGPYLNHKKYVKITKANYDIWSDFKWKPKAKSDQFLNKILLAKVKYHHSNGSTYYSLYDLDGKWQGYINAKATTEEKNDQGPYLTFGKKVRITDKTMSIWSNFNWKKKTAAAEIYNKVYTAKGKYQHANGSIFYSMFDTNDNWMGYINANGTELATDQGLYQKHNKYVRIKSKGYGTWSSFNWVEKLTPGELYNQKLLARGKYDHANGSVYYSLYDTEGKWHGYINEKATEPFNDQGPYVAFGKKVKITSKNYNIWSNFNWKKKSTSASKYNQTFTAKGLYKHSNGSTFYSIFDTKGNWQGYINKNATKLV